MPTVRDLFTRELDPTISAPAESTRPGAPKKAPRTVRDMFSEQFENQPITNPTERAASEAEFKETVTALRQVTETIAAIPEPVVLAAMQAPEGARLFAQSLHASTPEEQTEIRSRHRQMWAELHAAGNRQAAAAVAIAGAGVTKAGVTAVWQKVFGPIAKNVWGRSLANAAEFSAGLAAFNAMWEPREGEEKPGTGTMAAMGVGIGGGGTLALAGTKAVVKKVLVPAVTGLLRVLETHPVVQQFTARDTRVAQVLWDGQFTRGENVLAKAGAGKLAADLKEARAAANQMAGGFDSDFAKAIKPLTQEEIHLVPMVIQGEISLRRAAGGAFTELEKFVSHERAKEVIKAAAKVNRNLRFVGMAQEVYGIPVANGAGEIHAFQAIRGFIPHRFANPKAWIEGPLGMQEEAIKKVLHPVGGGRLRLPDGTPVTTKETAREYLENLVSKIEGEAEAGIEPLTMSSRHAFARTLDLPGYEHDLRLVLPQYHSWVSRKLSNAAHFGRPVEGVPTLPTRFNSIMEQRKEFLFGEGRTPKKIRGAVAEGREAAEAGIAEETAAPIVGAPETELQAAYPRAFEALDEIQDPTSKAQAEKILRDQLGQVTAVTAPWRMLNKAASLNVLDKLTFSQIIQPTQMVNAVAMTEWRGAHTSMIKAITRDPEAWDFATRSGAITSSITRHAQQELATLAKGGNLAGKRLDEIGFTFMDLVPRVAASLQGASFSEHAAKELVRLRSLTNLSRRNLRRIDVLEGKFQRIGLDPEEIMRQGGRLSEFQLLRAGQTASTEANFWSDALSLPRFYRTTEGRFFLQFKSFAQQQSTFVKKHLIDPARRGDPEPLVRWLVGSQVAGEVIADIRSLIFGRERPSNMALRIADNYANSAGFGIMWDSINFASRSLGSAYGVAVGPTVSTIGGELGAGVGGPLVTGTQKAFSGDIERAQKDFERAGRNAGRFFVRRVLPLYNKWTALSVPLVDRALFPKKKKEEDE